MGPTAKLPFQSSFSGKSRSCELRACSQVTILTGVGSHSSHDAEQRARRHTFAIIHWLTLADRGEQYVMLMLVHIVLRTLEGPGSLAFDAGQRTAPDRQGAFRAENIIGILVVAAFDLTTAEECANVVGVEVIHLEVIVDIADAVRDLPPTHRNTTYRRLVLERPSDLVGGVDCLFD